MSPWADGLAPLVAGLRRDWGLTLDRAPVRTGGSSLAVSVHRGSEPAMLRLVPPSHDLGGEVAALSTWDGHGAVRLLAADVDRGALLLERLDADASLDRRPVADAAPVQAELLRRLDRPAPDGVARLADLVPGLAEAVADEPDALQLLAELEPGVGDRLIHADLHGGNVLRDLDHTRWAAIDPKALVGEPEFCLPEMIWTRADDLPDAAAIRDHLRAIVTAAGLDLDRARAWTIIRALDYRRWGLAHGLTIDPPRCTRVVDALR